MDELYVSLLYCLLISFRIKVNAFTGIAKTLKTATEAPLSQVEVKRASKITTPAKQAAVTPPSATRIAVAELAEAIKAAAAVRATTAANRATRARDTEATKETRAVAVDNANVAAEEEARVVVAEEAREVAVEEVNAANTNDARLAAAVPWEINWCETTSFKPIAAPLLSQDEAQPPTKLMEAEKHPAASLPSATFLDMVGYHIVDANQESETTKAGYTRAAAAEEAKAAATFRAEVPRAALATMVPIEARPEATRAFVMYVTDNGDKEDWTIQSINVDP